VATILVIFLRIKAKNKLHLTKSGGLKARRAMDIKKWAQEPRSLTEVYAYVCT